MLIIRDVLISEDIVEEHFHCNLSACKGACCREGDYGAPVDEEEIQKIKEYTETIMEILPERSQCLLRSDGGFTYYKTPETWGTSCHDDGACVFLTTNESGISMCGIELTWIQKKIPFQKPISCHLYPVRVSKNDIVGFEAWNYDRWDICSAACTKGKDEKMPLFRFVKDSIIRLKGDEFYEELEDAAAYLKQSQI